MESQSTYEDWENEALSLIGDLAIDEDNVGLFLVIGHILNDHKRHEEAKDAYRKALLCNPLSEAVYCSLLTTCQSEGNLDDAVRWAIESINAGLGLPDDFTLDLYSEGELQRVKNALESWYRNKDLN